jgi:hypothetical protein
MATQSEIVKRIEEICKEFDERLALVGVKIARLELARALAKLEAAQSEQTDVCPECLGMDGYHQRACSKWLTPDPA